MGHNVVHFAIHADDVERARVFYEQVFGWRFEAWGPPGFYNVETGTDERPGIHGALHEREHPLGTVDGATEHTAIRGFTCTVAVEDLDDVRARVVTNGGTIRHEPMDIPTVGRVLNFLDSEGNEVSAMVYDRPMFGM